MRAITSGNLLRPCWILALFLTLTPAPGRAAVPTWLPCYDMDVRLDTEGHVAHLVERVTWINRHQRPADELVFNSHAHFKLAEGEVGMTAKIFEILRLSPGEVIDDDGQAGQVRSVRLLGRNAGLVHGKPYPLPFHYRKDMDTALVVPLPGPVRQGESVTVEIEYELRLPHLQGRWGQWKGVTTLANWYPVLACYDEAGWQPTPFIPWHQPFFNESGLYKVRLTLPPDQKVAATAPVQTQRLLGDRSLREIVFQPCRARDFAILSSSRYREFTAQAGPVRLRCLAFPEHEFYAQAMLESAVEALQTFGQWFGPYPDPEFTLAESFFGWHGNECGALAMIDARIFDMPHAARAFVDLLICQQVCHQWWYNLVGTNGYCETWMDEGLVTYFAYRLACARQGKDTNLARLPSWLPNVRREDYRYFNLYGTLGRGEAGPTVQDLPRYDHIVNVYSMCYERGGKVVGMIENRLGELAFLDFIRRVVSRYSYRVLRVADFRRELEEYTGESWEEFFTHWVYGAGMTDWCLENVSVKPLKDPRDQEEEPNILKDLASLLPEPSWHGPCEVTVLLRQKAEYNEPTVLGFCLDGSDNFQVRIPIVPQARFVKIDEVDAVIEALPDNQMRVRIRLPSPPTQIAVDPDQVLVDPNPINNWWKPRLRVHLSPICTFLDETDLTNAYDRWNINAGPWVYTATYDNPWFTRSTMLGARVQAYRTQSVEASAYSAYRTDYRDFVTGVDLVLDHFPWNHTEVGLIAERRLAGFLQGQNGANRGVLYGRYVIDYSDSLYLPPFHYIEAFSTVTDNMLPTARETLPGAERYKHQAMSGLHYHINYLTPYWDAEGGFQFDGSYLAGVEVPGETSTIEGAHIVTGQLSWVNAVPDGLGWLSETRFAFRAYGAAGFPNNVQYFALGGGELFRGFDLAQRQGSRVWVGSVEWRVPLARHLTWDCCDHVLGLRNIWAAAFSDTGSVYLRNQPLGSVAESLGVGLRLDVAWVSFVERTILRLDVAKTVNSNTPWQIWFGLEHPF